MPIPCNLRVPEYPGSSEKEGREDTIDVFEVRHHIELPHRAEDGRATGVRVYGPLHVTAEIDKATPGLHKACVTGQRLGEVSLTFFRIDPSARSEQPYYIITLRSARIVEVDTQVALTFDRRHKERRQMITYGFVAEAIEWNWLPDSVVESDSWQKPGAG